MNNYNFSDIPDYPPVPPGPQRTGVQPLFDPVFHPPVANPKPDIAPIVMETKKAASPWPINGIVK